MTLTVKSELYVLLSCSLFIGCAGQAVMVMHANLHFLPAFRSVGPLPLGTCANKQQIVTNEDNIAQFFFLQP